MNSAIQSCFMVIYANFTVDERREEGRGKDRVSNCKTAQNCLYFLKRVWVLKKVGTIWAMSRRTARDMGRVQEEGERKGGKEPQWEGRDTFRSWRCNGHSSVNKWQKPQGERGGVEEKTGRGGGRVKDRRMQVNDLKNWALQKILSAWRKKSGSVSICVNVWGRAYVSCWDADMFVPHMSVNAGIKVKNWSPPRISMAIIPPLPRIGALKV